MILCLMLRIILLVLVVLPVTMVMIGCSQSYEPLTRPIEDQNLVGVWYPTPESVALLVRESIPFSTETLKLELRADGSFSLPGIPDCWIDDFGDCSGTVLNITGTWSTYQEKEGTPNRLHLVIGNGAPRARYSVPLSNSGASISIAFFLGDSDRGRVITFKRR